VTTSSKPSDWLLSHARNVQSQSGEDGILQKTFEVLPAPAPAGRWSVEFGAWDGKKFSNTCNLVTQLGWNGMFIEADPVKFGELKQAYAGHP
jgi:hypothetical protein